MVRLDEIVVISEICNFLLSKFDVTSGKYRKREDKTRNPEEILQNVPKGKLICEEYTKTFVNYSCKKTRDPVHLIEDSKMAKWLTTLDLFLYKYEIDHLFK